MTLESYLDKKGAEYAPFEPNRAKEIYQKLQPFIKIPPHIIHILGTNGKGSTGRFIALGLEQNQESVFHFTSPHIFRFNERFYKNGTIVTNDALEKAHLFLQQFECVHRASYFEYATFLALVLAQDCRYLVLEAGLGGEYDSTSVLEAGISVFTPISYDHQEILGESIEQIATTKLKAMSHYAFIASQPYEEVNHIAKQIALQKHTKLFFVDSSMQSRDLQEYVKKYDLAYFLAENLTMAQYVLEFLGKSIDFGTLKGVNLDGRAHRIAPHILVDVGHNEACARAILKIINNKSVNLVYIHFFKKMYIEF